MPHHLCAVTAWGRGLGGPWGGRAHGAGAGGVLSKAGLQAGRSPQQSVPTGRAGDRPARAARCRNGALGHPTPTEQGLGVAPDARAHGALS